MSLYLRWGLRISIVIYTVLHFFTYFYPTTVLNHILSITGFLLLIFAAITLKLKSFKLPLFLLAISVIIMLLSGTSLMDVLFNGFLKMRDIIGLLVIIPMISWVLQEESYIDAILKFTHHIISTSKRFYFGMGLITQVFSCFLLFGSIPMLYQVVNGIFKDKEGMVWEHFKSTILIRSFALTTMWVMSMPSFIFAVGALGASLSQSMLQGIIFSLLGILMATIFFHFEEKSYGASLTPDIREEIKKTLHMSKGQFNARKNVIEFAILFISLFGSILLLNSLVDVDLIIIIPLTILVWTIIFYAYKKRIHHLAIQGKNHISHDIDRQGYQLSVMLGAGILIFSLNTTDFAQTVIGGLYALQEGVPFINILLILPFVFILLGFFGLGPLTVMVLVAGLLESISLPFPPELIVLAATSGSVISVLISPVIMPVLVLSGENGLSPLKNGLKFNWKFAICFYIVIQIYVQTRVYFA